MKIFSSESNPFRLKKIRKLIASQAKRQETGRPSPLQCNHCQNSYFDILDETSAQGLLETSS